MEKKWGYVEKKEVGKMKEKIGENVGEKSGEKVGRMENKKKKWEKN